MHAKISLTHLALHVRDLAASVAFYERFCGLRCIHRRGEQGQGPSVAWLAEPGREREFILVFISGGPTRSTQGNDFSHLGVALQSRQAVDAVAARAQTEDVRSGRRARSPIPLATIVVLRIRTGASSSSPTGSRWDRARKRWMSGA